MHFFCSLVLFFSVLLKGIIAQDNFFIYPPSNGQFLAIPGGSPVAVKWNSTYPVLDLTIFQRDPTGGFAASTVLSNVSNPPGLGSVSWAANNISTLSAGGSLHFGISLVSNGQSLDGFNSGGFNLTDGSAVKTLVPPTSTLASSTTSAPVRSTKSSKPTVTPSTNSNRDNSRTLKLGLGLGLGLGIPLIVLTLVLLVYFRKRRRTVSQLREFGVQQSEAQPSILKTSEGEYLREVDGRALYEAGTEPVMHEMSAEQQ